ncbi:hypothetical protein [Streptomyces sp. NPDC046332]|uniref:hypothetical protein n=1 Tax=unclassified Streptomyces TaxID=2593676 RepID=UPI0033CAAD3A
MTRKKLITARVRARRSFMDIREGHEATVVVDSVVQGWIDAGHMDIVEEVDGGEDPAGPGSAEPDDAGSVEE